MNDVQNTLSSFDANGAVADLLGFAAADVPRFSTGFSLDDTCGCIGPGEFALMWARSGSGKSTWLLNVISNSPRVPTVVFNMEMSPRRQMEWLTAMTFDLQCPAREMGDVLRAGTADARYPELLQSLRAMQSSYPALTFVSPQKAPTLKDFAMKVDEIEDVTGVRPQRVFIDHLTLMKDARNYENVTTLAAAMHSWAMNENLAVIAIQQTGRGGQADGSRNDGHIPVTLSSGIYAGEHDADWIYGLYRPERDPYFSKPMHAFKNVADYEAMILRHEEVKGIARLQLIKNRPYGETREAGIELHYWSHSRRLVEGRP